MSAPVQRAPGDVLVHLRRARDRIDRHYAEPLDLEALARTAGISKFHFHRLFTATYGRTPAAYLSERRIERAQDLLRATNLTVTEVSHAGCFVLMWGLAETTAQKSSASQEKPDVGDPG